MTKHLTVIALEKKTKEESKKKFRVVKAWVLCVGNEMWVLCASAMKYAWVTCVGFLWALQGRKGTSTN
jgi:hypothetical protein